MNHSLPSILILLTGLVHSCCFATETQRPNIVFILCDDLGYADVGFGAKVVGEAREISPDTPNLDTLARNGMVCTNAYIPHPFCGPSRMGILTGRYPHHFGGSKNLPNEATFRPSQEVRKKYGYEAANSLGIPASEVTFAKVLNQAGYHTGQIGKWHCGLGDHSTPLAVGFDYQFGMLGGGHSYYSDGWIPKEKAKNDYQFYLTRNEVAVAPEPGKYLTDVLSQDAVQFIRQAPKNKPFMLFLAYNAPHAPLQGKKEDLIHRFGGDGKNESYTKEQITHAMVYAVDRGVGDIVAALNEKEILKDTLIVFQSDNGGKEGEDENQADNGRLKGGKGDVYDGGVRTPMFIHYPKQIAAGSVYNHPVYPYDLFPTFARLGHATDKIPSGKKLSGVDLWDGLKANTNVHTKDTVFWVRHNGGANDVGMRLGNFKATRRNNGRWSLYDLESDLSESNDVLSSENVEILDEMLRQGNRWKEDGVDPLWHDTDAGYLRWNEMKMPNYDKSFSRRPLLRK